MNTSVAVTTSIANKPMKTTKKQVRSAKKLAKQPRCATPRIHNKAHRKAEPKVKTERCLDLINNGAKKPRIAKQMNSMEAAFANAQQ